MAAMPKRIADLKIVKSNDEDGCMECGGPGLADMDTNANWNGDMYYSVENELFCSVDCVERWHGIELQ